jgi:hypothetical protein
MRAYLPPRAVGVGSIPLPLGFNQAQIDLQNQFVLVVNAGNTYLTAGETANALAAYKAAGMTGATTIGPEIDLSGMPNTTQEFTQQAWQFNGLLQATTDAPTAQKYANAMETLYQLAIAAAKEVANNAADPSELDATPGVLTIGPNRLLFGTLFAGALGGLAWVWLQR